MEQTNWGNLPVELQEEIVKRLDWPQKCKLKSMESIWIEFDERIQETDVQKLDSVLKALRGLNICSKIKEMVIVVFNVIVDPEQPCPCLRRSFEYKIQGLQGDY